MKKLLVSVVFILLVTQNGCGSNSPGDKLSQEIIAIINEDAEKIEKSDPPDWNTYLEESKQRLNEFTHKMTDISARMKQLQISDDEKKRLDEKYKDALDKARQRLSDADTKLRQQMIEKTNSTES